MLKSCFQSELVEAGCDEAGRGCIAGPVFAAAVILPPNYRNKELNDSKLLTEKQREKLRKQIEKHALSWAVGQVDHSVIDRINILRASFKAMHLALDQLEQSPELLLIDGNRFIPYKSLPYHCVIKGDGKYLSIAAASILAKTYRDDYMKELHISFPEYSWNTNKGYPTEYHREMVKNIGMTRYHRKTFRLFPEYEQVGLF